MPSEFLALLESGCAGRVATVAAGETVFRRGDTVRWLNLVIHGRIRLRRVLSRGSEIALARVVGGEVLAEASVFSARYHCDAVSETQSTLKRYAMRDVTGLLRDRPRAASAYSAYLAARLAELRTTVEIRSIRRADDRLLAWLRLHARGTPRTFDGQGTWLSLARQIGLTGEAVYRALAALERSGTIRRQDGNVILR